MDAPFRLLILTHERPFWLRCPDGHHVAVFRLPDGGESPMGLPAATEAAAVHNLFEADAGRPLAQPSATHLVPLARATLGLCGNASRVAWIDECLLSHPVTFSETTTRGTWARMEAQDDIKGFFSGVQGAVACAHEIEELLNALAADPDAHTMRDHPLTGYAELTALLTLDLCVMQCDAMGIPGAITRGKAKGNFTVNFDPHDSRWATQQATLWWEGRDTRMRHYHLHLDRIAAKAPTREELAKRIDAGLTAVADDFIKKSGQPRPAILDTNASWLDKWRALEEGARLH